MTSPWFSEKGGFTQEAEPNHWKDLTSHLDIMTCGGPRHCQSCLHYRFPALSYENVDLPELESHPQSERLYHGFRKQHTKIFRCALTSHVGDDIFFDEDFNQSS